MAKQEFWNDLGNKLRNLGDNQLTHERWSGMDMVGEGNALAVLGVIGTGVAVGMNRVIEAKAGESLVGEIAKGASRVVVAGGLALTAGGIWYATESWRALGLVMNEQRRRAAYLGALPENVYNQAIKKSVQEGFNGRGTYQIAKEMLGAK